MEKWLSIYFAQSAVSNGPMPVLDRDAVIRSAWMITAGAAAYGVIASRNDTAANLTAAGTHEDLLIVFSAAAASTAGAENLWIPWDAGRRLYLAVSGALSIMLYYVYSDSLG